MTACRGSLPARGIHQRSAPSHRGFACLAGGGERASSGRQPITAGVHGPDRPLLRLDGEPAADRRFSWRRLRRELRIPVARSAAANVDTRLDCSDRCVALYRLTLLATLIHLDRFHVNSFIGQLWLVIYAIAPPVMVVLLVRQWRTLGVDPDRTRPLATWLRILLGVQALVLIPAGAGLFLAPQLSPQLWPWVLTPLTARAIGAWLIAVWRGHEPSRLGERPGPRVDRTRQFCDLRRAAAGRNRPLSSYSELAQPAGLAVCAVPGAPARIRG